MKRFVSLCLLPLAGCAALSAAGITPASAPMILAVAAEMRAGANVIRANAAGDRLNVQLWCFRIRQARTAVNGTVRLQMSEDVRAALDESRRLTEDVCNAAGVPVTKPIPTHPGELPLPADETSNAVTPS